MLLYIAVRNESFESASEEWRDEIFPCIISMFTRMEDAAALRNMSAQKK
jgi:hypothetical protein